MKIIDRIENKYNQSLLKEYIDLFLRFRIPAIAGSEAFNLTLTFFPLIIVLYTMMGDRYPTMMRLLSNFEKVMTPSTFKAVSSFFGYVARNTDSPMFVAALIVLLTSSSAAFRAVYVTIGKMQGRIRFRGIFGFLLSFPLAMIFILLIYLAIMLMLSGRGVLNQLQRFFPHISMTTFWNSIRIVLLIAILFLFIYFVYQISIPRRAKYNIKPGAIMATVLLVSISFLFGSTIDVFARYPLVYGSLASVILLMLWLYLCSFSVLLGAVLNVVLFHRSQKDELLSKEEKQFEEDFPMTEYHRIVDDEPIEYYDEYYDEY